MADFCTCDEFTMGDSPDSFGFLETDAEFPLPIELGGTGATDKSTAANNLFPTGYLEGFDIDADDAMAYRVPGNPGAVYAASADKVARSLWKILRQKDTTPTEGSTNAITSGAVAAAIADSIDDTLTLPNKAADAKAAGDAIGELKSTLYDFEKSGNLSSLSLENNGLCIDYNDTAVSNSMVSHTGYIEIPANAESITCGNLTSNAAGSQTYHIYPNVLFYDSEKNRLYTVNSNQDVATYNIPTTAKYVRVNQPSKTAPIAERLIKFNIINKAGFCGRSKLAFTSTATQKGTVIYLEAGKPYVIECLTEIAAGNVNCYVYNATGIFVSFFSKGSRFFIPPRSGYLYAYNVSGTFTGDFEVVVYEADGLLAKCREVPTVYEVGSSKTNTSLTGLLYALKNDDTEKIIYIDGGDYDIFREYTDLGLLSGEPPANPTLDYFDYNVLVPPNTHIIGRGLVRLLWEPTAEQISAAWSKTISPINMAGSATLENVEIYCKNGRYCIHDDPLGKTAYTGARKRYKNVRCYKEINDDGYGFGAVIGFGIDSRMTYVFENCLFQNNMPGYVCFYMHDRTPSPNVENSGSTVIVNNCVMNPASDGASGVSLGNTGSASQAHIRMVFSSCHIGGRFRVGDESDKTQGTNPNHFDITLLRCNDIAVTIASAENPYPAKVFN